MTRSPTQRNCYSIKRTARLRAELTNFGRLYRQKLCEFSRVANDSAAAESCPFVALFDRALRAKHEAPIFKRAALPPRPDYLYYSSRDYTPLHNSNVPVVLEFVLAAVLHDRAEDIFEPLARRKSVCASAGISMGRYVKSSALGLNDPTSWETYLTSANFKLAFNWLQNASDAHLVPSLERARLAKIEIRERNTAAGVGLCLKALSLTHTIPGGRYRVMQLENGILPSAEADDIHEYIFETRDDGRAVTFQYEGFPMLAAPCKDWTVHVHETREGYRKKLGHVDSGDTYKIFIVPEAFLETGVRTPSLGYQLETWSFRLELSGETTVTFSYGDLRFVNADATITFESGGAFTRKKRN